MPCLVRKSVARHAGISSAIPPTASAQGQPVDVVIVKDAVPAVKLAGKPKWWRWLMAAAAATMLLVGGIIVILWWSGVRGTGRADEAELPPGVPRPALPQLKFAIQVKPPKPVTIKPPVLEKDRVVRQLPAAVNDVAVGGNGRFLILHLPALRKLAIFDANEGRVIHYLAVTGETVKFTAGMDKLIVATGNTLQRWSLLTLEQEATAPVKGKVKVVGMGSGSNGPLLLGMDVPDENAAKKNEWTFFDLATLQPLQVAGGDRQALDLGNQANRVQISADGKIFRLMEVEKSSWGGNQTFVLNEGELTVYPQGGSRELFTGRGLYDNQINGYALRMAHTRDFFSTPSHQGNYYVQLPCEKDSLLEVRLQDLEKPLLTIDPGEVANADGVRDIGPPLQQEASSMSVSKCFHLIPGARLLVLIPPSKDRLILQRCDADEALAKLETERLLVLSQPPLSVKPGETFTYQIEAKPTKGKVQFHLESGPPKMALSPDGKLTWRVPADCAAAYSTAVVSIRDGAGQEAFHSFWLRHPGNKAFFGRGTEPPKPGPASVKAPMLEKDRVRKSPGCACRAGGGGRRRTLSDPAPRQGPATRHFRRQRSRRGPLHHAS